MTLKGHKLTFEGEEVHLADIKGLKTSSEERRKHVGVAGRGADSSGDGKTTHGLGRGERVEDSKGRVVSREWK